MNINNISKEALLQELLGKNPELQKLLELQKNLTQQAKKNKMMNEFRGRRKKQPDITDALMGKLETIACALGACPLCWGDDADCKECGGVGGCGTFLPDMDCFDVYVRPVLNVLMEQEKMKQQHNELNSVNTHNVTYIADQPKYLKEKYDHE